MINHPRRRRRHGHGHGRLIFLAVILLSLGPSEPDIRTGYRVTVAIPPAYSPGYVGRAYLMGADGGGPPAFRVALSVEAGGGGGGGSYTCALEVFLGDVRVWSSGHSSRFYVEGRCALELAADGDLRLKGPDERIGWRTGTSGQAVEIQGTGNLVLVDASDRIKWQSFNFPTDVMLWGQRLSGATRLTSYPANSTSFYSFEIEQAKVALYLNHGGSKYSYWEFAPSLSRNITFVKLGTRGLELFNYKYKKIARITAPRSEPPRFLALDNQTGNMGLYYYSPGEGKFAASFLALNATCDLPMSCPPYGICTLSSACSCIRLTRKRDETGLDCGDGISGGFCGAGRPAMEMIELDGVDSVIRDGPKRVNVSKEECTSLCTEDCDCAAALYSSYLRECYVYGIVIGIKQVNQGSGLSYLVKVPKGSRGRRGRSGLKRWVLVLVGVVDGLILAAVIGGLVYYLIRKRRKRSSGGARNDS
ncbi:PAN domain-containing protein At5g03700 isoform X2 [Syzygium oleosum]|uniref:PAN domain-containing protein At5g03700 isoform X2 n=1 Tax=Syzygium oleosum TaxID=219896 RepID=UPI0024BB3B34|nr:PAN domain-containing protein At5g03700 isoform X2 [Syzygium oleosum]